MEHPESTPSSPNSPEFEPSLPYAGTGGFAGSDTSREQAYAEATSGVTGAHQKYVLILALQAGAKGITVAEARESKGGLHHGKISSALSCLHQEGRLAALKARRGKCGIYVLPEFVGEREVRVFKHNRKDADPEVIVGVLLDHYRHTVGDYCHGKDCTWQAGYGSTFTQHQAEMIAEALNA